MFDAPSLSDADDTPSADPSDQDGGQPGGGAASDSPADLVLDAPTVSVDELEFEVDRLELGLSIETQVGSLVQFRAGLSATLSGAKLALRGVEAEAHLSVDLENTRRMIAGAVHALTTSPELVEKLAEAGAQQLGRSDASEQGAQLSEGGSEHSGSPEAGAGRQEQKQTSSQQNAGGGEGQSGSTQSGGASASGEADADGAQQDENQTPSSERDGDDRGSEQAAGSGDIPSSEEQNAGSQKLNGEQDGGPEQNGEAQDASDRNGRNHKANGSGEEAAVAPSRGEEEQRAGERQHGGDAPQEDKLIVDGELLYRVEPAGGGIQRTTLARLDGLPVLDERRDADGRLMRTVRYGDDVRVCYAVASDGSVASGRVLDEDEVDA